MAFSVFLYFVSFFFMLEGQSQKLFNFESCIQSTHNTYTAAWQAHWTDVVVVVAVRTKTVSTTAKSSSWRKKDEDRAFPSDWLKQNPIEPTKKTENARKKNDSIFIYEFWWAYGLVSIHQYLCMNVERQHRVKLVSSTIYSLWGNKPLRHDARTWAQPKIIHINFFFLAFVFRVVVAVVDKTFPLWFPPTCIIQITVVLKSLFPTFLIYMWFNILLIRFESPSIGK